MSEERIPKELKDVSLSMSDQLCFTHPICTPQFEVGRWVRSIVSLPPNPSPHRRGDVLHCSHGVMAASMTHCVHTLVALLLCIHMYCGLTSRAAIFDAP